MREKDKIQWNKPLVMSFLFGQGQNDAKLQGTIGMRGETLYVVRRLYPTQESELDEIFTEDGEYVGYFIRDEHGKVQLIPRNETYSEIHNKIISKEKAPKQIQEVEERRCKYLTKREKEYYGSYDSWPGDVHTHMEPFCANEWKYFPKCANCLNYEEEE